MSVDSVVVTYNISGQRKNGTSFTTSTTQSFGKASDGSIGVDGIDSVIVDITPSSQNVTRTNTGTYGAPGVITTSVVQGATAFTYDDTVSYGNSTFYINNITNCTNNDNGTVTPTTPTTVNPVTSTFDVIHKNSEGTTTTISKSHTTTITLDGNTGPGIVHTGLWVTGTIYQFDNGNSGNPGTARRDSVLHSGTYYAVTSQHTSTSTGTTGPPGVGSNWESMGTQDLFVAAKVAIFEESYVQNTLNIGTNNSGGVHAANITLAGGSANPYIAIGQSSQGYGNTGIWLGNDTGSYSLSLVGASNHMKWNGSALDIQGKITMTSGPQLDQLGHITAETGSLQSGIVGATSSGSLGISNASAAQSTANSKTKVFRQTTTPSSTTIGDSWYDTDDGNKLRISSATGTSDWETTVDGTIATAQGTANTATASAATAQSTADGINANTGSLANPSTYSFGSVFPLDDAGGSFANGLNLTSDYLGYYDGSSWKSYMAADGGFYLGGAGSNALQWDGSTLAISGNVVITGGSTLTALNAASSSAGTALTDANEASASAAGAQGTADTGVANALTAQDTADGINANTGSLKNPNAYSFGGSGLTLQTESPGTGLNLNAQFLGYHNGTDFQSYMAHNGDFFLKGTDGSLTWNSVSSSLIVQGRISGSSIEGGTLIGSTLNIPNASSPKFSVDVDGNMVAQDATISGSISVNDGVIGLWNVKSKLDGGHLQNKNSNPTLILDPQTPEILFKSGSAGGVYETKLRIKPHDEWQSTAGSNITINDMDYTIASYGTYPTSLNDSSTVWGAYVNETNTTGTYTITQGGTFAIDIYQPQTIDLSTPASTSAGYTWYPNYNPTYAGQQHPAFGYGSSGVSFTLYYYLEAINVDTSVVTRVLVKNVSVTGQYTNSNTYTAQSAGYGLQWQQNYGSTVNANTTYNYTNVYTQLEKSLNLDAGDYKFRYSTRVGVSSGRRMNTNASGTTSFTYVTDQFSIDSYVWSSNQANITVVIPTNIIELTSKGLQILNDSDTYVQLSRLSSGYAYSQPTLINVKGGKLAISGQDSSNSADLTAKYGQFGTGSFSRIDSFGYSNGTTSNGGVRDSIDPHRDNVYDIGTSAARWDDIYATNGNINTSDRTQKENISGSDLGLEFINNLEPVKYNWISGSRTHYGLIAQQVSESLASSSIDTDDFAGYIASDIYESGSMTYTKKYIDKLEWDIHDFTIVDTKYGLRYSEMISPMIKAIQELTQKVTELENQLSGSL